MQHAPLVGVKSPTAHVFNVSYDKGKRVVLAADGRDSPEAALKGEGVKKELCRRKIPDLQGGHVAEHQPQEAKPQRTVGAGTTF